MTVLNLTKIENPVQRAIAKAMYDPDWFCAYILQSPNDPWQSEMMNVVADLDRARVGLPTLFNHDLKNKVTICAFHGPGKTHYLAKMIHWFLFTRRGVVPCTGPKEKTLTTRTWPEFRRILGGATDFYKALVKVTATRIVFGGDMDWCAVVESANKPDNLQGYHAANLMFLVEEASGVNNDMFPAIEGALTTDGSILIMIGNPVSNAGEFYDSHNRAGTKEDYYIKKIKHNETKRVTKKWVNMMIRKHGINSPVVQSRVFGNFVKSSDKQLIDYEWMELALNREFKEDGSIPVLVVSADVADGGIDFSVITVMLFYATQVLLVKQKKYNFPSAVSPIDVGKEMIKTFKKYKGKKGKDKMVPDAVGVGAGTAGYLIDQGYRECTIAFKGGESKDKKFRNQRSKCYLSLKNAAMRGQLYIAEDFVDEQEDWDEFVDQLCKVRYADNNDKEEDIETKKEYIKRVKKSPDRADSAAMGFVVKYFKTNSFGTVDFSGYGVVSTLETA